MYIPDLQKKIRSAVDAAADEIRTSNAVLLKNGRDPLTMAECDKVTERHIRDALATYTQRADEHKNFAP